MTGVTNQLGDLAGRWLQLAKDVVPRLRHIGIVWNPADAGSASSFKDSQESYARLGIKVTSVTVTPPEDFEAGFEILSRELPNFLIVHPSPVIFRHRQRVTEFAVRNRLPTGTGSRAKARTMANPVSFLLSSPGGTRLGLIGTRSTPGAVEAMTSPEIGTPPSA